VLSLESDFHAFWNGQHEVWQYLYLVFLQAAPVGSFIGMGRGGLLMLHSIFVEITEGAA
jgi:hypothetical protein